MITDEQREQIHLLGALGLSQRAIAAKVGCGQATVARNLNPAVRDRERDVGLERTQRLAAIKMASGCVDCGYAKHWSALDFDHLPGFKKLFNVGVNVNRKWCEVEREITKCEVVCSNCHRIRTYERSHSNG